MSNYNWCHNPDCHKIKTQSRVRGSGSNKVLRTRKIPLTSEYIRKSIWSYFCNQNCLHGFLNQFRNEIANINPVRKPSETPIKVEVKTHDFGYMEGKTYKVITAVDND
tara:strand:- start:356 stop:679 length:324 start_codon:yes stop_codon:yes gene_type:complete